LLPVPLKIRYRERMSVGTGARRVGVGISQAGEWENNGPVWGVLEDDLIFGL
jgi:hypothetical protein